MTIKFSDGRTATAVMLARTGVCLRVALEGVDDVVSLVERNGRWITEDCEAVHVDFEWEKRTLAAVPDEADCICPKDLAVRLIHSLLCGGEAEPGWQFPVEPPREPSAIHII